MGIGPEPGEERYRATRMRRTGAAAGGMQRMAGVQRRAQDAQVSTHERRAWDNGRGVVGLDEVGRGALAGPVTVGAVILDPSRMPVGARDSKLLSPARRVALAQTLHATALVGIGSASNEEIDGLGLAAALTEAARRALDAVLSLPEAPVEPLILVDGPHDLVRRAGLEVTALVGGDSASISIASASIVAKVDRDQRMSEADGTHPPYGFARNRGYASPEHLEALSRHGPCELHRLSWAPIARLRQPELDI